MLILLCPFSLTTLVITFADAYVLTGDKVVSEDYELKENAFKDGVVRVILRFDSTYFVPNYFSSAKFSGS